MPKPRSLTATEEQDAYAKYRDCMKARGSVAMLAREHQLTWVGMKGILDRVERETQFKDSRESLNAGEPQP